MKTTLQTMALTIFDTQGNPIPWNLEEWIRNGEPMKMEELHKKVIITYLNRYGTKQLAAQKLKISVRNLFRLIKQYNITTD